MFVLVVVFVVSGEDASPAHVNMMLVLVCSVFFGRALQDGSVVPLSQGWVTPR